MDKKERISKDTISGMISLTLQKIFLLILCVVILIGLSMFLFTRYTGVVNSAGIVRGGSQRVIKLVLADADEKAGVAAVETNLNKIEKEMHLGGFPKKRDAVEDYWNNTIKKDIESYKSSKNSEKILKDSETFFQMTNEMVNSAQSMVDVIAIVLYVILAAFLIVCLVTFKGVSKIFSKSVVEPIAELETDLNNLANGMLRDELVYEKKDEIGNLYDVLNRMRESILKYVQDIDKNLNVMADGDLVSKSDMNYQGDYVPIQSNINHIRQSLSGEFKSMDELADYVAQSAGQVSNVAQSLAEGAVAQTNSISDLQNKINMTMEENEKVDSFVDEARSTSGHTTKSVDKTRAQMEKAVSAMQDMSHASEEIRTIVKALEDISSETSLLSLNASIEAARAGEAGRGFAVVAESVGKLANESSESTVTITDLIENALESIQRGTSIVNDAASSLEEITSNTNEVDQVIVKLSEQSKIQNELMKEITSLSNRILDVVSENSAVSQQCAASSTELNNYSRDLKERVAKFVTN